MREEKYYISIFESKNYAIQLLYILENLGYKTFQLISTPSQIQAGCNFGIKFNDLSYLNIIKSESRRLNTDIRGLYSIERKNGKKLVRKLNHFI